MSEIAVFLGPSLPVAAARSVLDAVYLPPIKRGDLSQLDPEIRCIGIVDGEFYQSLAVSPKEILPLIEGGIALYGAASMGALRAVELEPYGMIGVGRVFEAYRDGIVEAEDEVALVYDRETYEPLSDPLINIRFALEGAARLGLIASSRAEEVLESLRKTWFPLRSYADVARLCPELASMISAGPPNQKAEDAVLLLHRMRRAWNK
ncbi:MAG TPA: TfuA-like protein [Acidobacteriaceae bacterium]|nr:TfuA-like protein [Acidobacteriaceae bacterium]